jgi:hypothetical protein
VTNPQWVFGGSRNGIFTQETQATVVKYRVHDGALNWVIAPPYDELLADGTPVANTGTSRKDPRTQNVTIAEATDLDSMVVAQQTPQRDREHRAAFQSFAQTQAEVPESAYSVQSD